MSAPTSPPLVLTTDVATTYNFAATNTASSQRVLDAICEVSAWLEGITGRYFAPRIETRYFDARSYMNGGDVDGSELWLDRDLQSTTPTISNGDGVAITAGQYILIPRNSSLNKRIVRLIPTSGVWWNAAGNDYESISLSATWCYGGQWKNTGLTASAVASDSTTTVTVSAATIVTGTIIKIDSEYMYVEAGGVVGLTVTRGYLGSTATTHSAAAPVTRWEADSLVQKVVKRMVTIQLEQYKSPLSGVASVGDFVTTFRIDRLPEDVRLWTSQLAFPTRIGGF